jgi:hypothetical protein
MTRNPNPVQPLAVVAMLAVVAGHASQPEPGPVQVFILAGQSNMEGQAVVDLDGPDYNDGCDPQTAVPQYETNLVNLIRDVRRELQAPDLPVVMGELTGPWVRAPKEWTALREAQAAAAAHPAFQGNVLFVPTHDFVRAPEDSPNPGHGHHEFGNAETCFLVGDALGRGMKALINATPP